ncbi:TetR/AcrR family transcriptional regulator [Amycolatopsis bartoniae]|nr:TetR/AcrR family transcriptional regulator [Amycolatopsis bartoniae]
MLWNSLSSTDHTITVIIITVALAVRCRGVSGNVLAVSAQHGFRPPQQARSRASLQKVLDSAEHILSTEGIDEFTVAAVAEHAGVSVGVIYRRFTGKEQLLRAVKDQLLEQLEAGVAVALRAASPGLRDVIGAFTHAMAHAFSSHTKAFPELLSGQPAEGAERGLQALATVQQALTDAAGPAVDAAAMRFVARSIIGSCVHRAASCRSWPDGLSWSDWAEATTELAMSYLDSPERTK